MIFPKGGVWVNQKKTGEFLKRLRKDKGLTQEQLAEHFCVSSRTVSRWETGSNMPDVEMLIELADFYDADVREIIDGERKSENMDKETKDTLKKVAQYATKESNDRRERLRAMLSGTTCLMLAGYVLFRSESKGTLNGLIPDAICTGIMWFLIGLCYASLVLYWMHCFGTLDKISQWKKRHRGSKQ